MRLRALALFALLLLPTAVAQMPPVPAAEAPATLRAEMDAFAAPAVPFAAAQAATLRVTVSCALAATSPQTGLPLVFEVATKPTWARIALDPPAALVDARACAGPEVVVPVVVYAYGGEGGRAGDKADVQVIARTTTPAGEESAAATQPLTLGYHGAMALKANSTSATIAPHGESAVTLTLESRANARSTFTFDVDTTDALRVDALAPVTLDPGQSVELQARFRGVRDSPSGQTDPIRITATSARETGGDEGASRSVDVLVATRGMTGSTPAERDTPAPALAIVVLALAGAAWTRRGRA